MANYKDSVALTEFVERIGQIIDDQLGGFAELAYDALPGAGKIVERYVRDVALQNNIYDPTNNSGIHFIYSPEYYKKRKYKNKVFVGNLKKVKRRKADSEPHIPLWNITEYGTKKGVRPRPIVDDVVRAASNDVASYIASYIQNNLY